MEVLHINIEWKPLLIICFLCVHTALLNYQMVSILGIFVFTVIPQIPQKSLKSLK